MTRLFITCLFIFLLLVATTAQAAPSVFLAEPKIAASLRQELDPEALADLERCVAQVLTDRRNMAVVTRLDMKNVLAKKESAQALGLDDAAYDVSLAGLNHTDLLAQLSLSRINGRFLVTVSLINHQEGRVVGRQTVPFKKEKTLHTAAEVAVRRVLGEKIPMPKEDDGSPGGDQPETAVPLLKPGKTLVMIRPPAPELLSPDGRMALEKRIAQTLHEQADVTAFTTAELADLAEREALNQALDAGDAEALSQAAKQTKAPHLLALTIGRVGQTVLVAGSLIDVAKAQVQNRDSILLPDTEQLAAAAPTVALGLFGVHQDLPPVPGKPNRFEVAMNQLMLGLAREFKPYKDNPLSRMAVLPLCDQGEEAQARQLGGEISRYLTAQLPQVHETPTVERERVDELASLRDLGQTDAMSDAELVELSRYLGAAVIVTGRVADVGTDFLLTLRAVETGLSMPLPAPHAFLPMGERGTLLKKAFVVKTKAGAIYRAFLPGWGQFYNGPKHHWKGGVIVAGVLAGLAAGGALIYLNQQKLDERKTWDTGGTKYLANCSQADASACISKINDLTDEADNLAYGSYGSFAAAGAFWLWGIIDAAIYGEDYSQAIYGE